MREGISVLKGCETFAGIYGSNSFHTIFLNNNSRAIILLRSSEASTVVNSELDVLKNLKTTYIESFINILPINFFTNGPFLFKVNQHCLDFFNYYNFNTDNVDFSINNDDIIRYLIEFAYTCEYDYHYYKKNRTRETIDVETLVNIINGLKLEYPTYRNSKNNLTGDIKKIEKINKIVWWIPIRKLRDKTRNILLRKLG